MKTAISIVFCTVVCNSAELVSRAPAISQTAAGASYAPVISANGRYVAFLSAAKNLTTNVPGRSLGVFIHDFDTGQTRLVHAAADHPSFSGDGELVAFARDEDGISQIVLHDQQSGLMTGLTAGSIALPNSPPPIGSSRPTLSADGRWVLFESSATNLINEPDTNALPDLFLHDVQLRSNILISVGAVPLPGGPFPPPPRQSFAPSLTPDGSRVAFLSQNIPAPGTNSIIRTEVWVRDVAQGAYLWASTNVDAFFGSTNTAYVCSHPVLSANGIIVVFKAVPFRTWPFQSLSNALILRHDLETAETTMIASNSAPEVPPALSHDGRYLAYDSLGQIFRYDAQIGSNEMATVNATGTSPANGTSIGPVLTPNGGRLVFLSTASDLIATGNPTMTYQVYVREFASGTTRLASVNTNGRPALRSLFGTAPQIHSQGTRVVFDYAGSDLASGDLNDASDVFLYSMEEGTVKLISRAALELPSQSSPAGIGAELNSVSVDGSKVAFAAYDIPSFAGDTNRQRDVFVADLNTGNIETLSRGDPLTDFRGGQGVISGNGRFGLYFRQTYPDSGSPYFDNRLWFFWRDLVSGRSEQVDPEPTGRLDIGVQNSSYPALSDDGNIIVFTKRWDSQRTQIYLKDMVAGTNQLVTVNRYNEPAWRNAINPALSPDGRWVLFQYNNPGELTTNTFANSGYNLFARDLVDGVTILISAYGSGVGMGTATAKSMSASGRYVAYDVWLRDDVPVPQTNIYVFDFVTRSNTLICSYCSDPSLNADARLVAYASRRAGSSINDIHVRDRAAGTVARIGDNVANDSSSRPLLSADGRYVVFTSRASNYVANDDNGAQDVFLHDRYRGVTYRLSAGSAPSARHIISSDGRMVVFQSLAADLSPGDYNEALDIFSVRLGAGDSDNDGIDDAWEVTYFDDTTRDGSADFDGDGHSDFSEFRAGTDPTEGGSVLEVIAIRSLSPDQVRILWSATVGKSYIIQARSSLEDAGWTNGSEPVTANATAMSLDLASASLAAFYRVVLVQ